MTESNIEPNAKPEVAIVGELKVNNPVRIHISIISPNGSKQEQKPLSSTAQVYISTNDTHKKRLTLENTSDPYYWISSEIIIEDQNEYSLEIMDQDKIISSRTQIPLPIETIVTNDQNDNTNFEISIKKNKSITYLMLSSESRIYIYESGIKVYKSDWKPIKLTTENNETDNLKYREIIFPFKRLYARIIDDQKIKFSISQDDTMLNADEHIEYRFLVKTVSQDLYNFMYFYDAQNSIGLLDIAHPVTTRGNIINGIGIFGSSNEEEFVF